MAILSKAGNNIRRDFDLLDNDDYIGATLTFNNKEDSLKWEPGAALPEERIQVLKETHDKGINTWVSLEPVIFPEQTLDLIDNTYEFVDMYKIGKLNYHQKAKEIDWQAFATKAIGKMKKYNKNYYIKKDLRKYITKPA
jgi:DNA repair photolyase